MTSLSITSTAKLSTGYEIPRLGLGVGRNSDCANSCEAALKHGYRHFDTANMYGNEGDVGIGVRNSGVKREDVFITSKVASEEHTSYDNVRSIIDASLTKLNTTYIDLYLIHDPGSGKERRLEAYKALLDAQAEGKIRSVGVSNYAVKHLKEIEDAGYATPAVNQLEIHPFCQQKDIVAYNDAHGIITEAYCPLIRGRFDDPVLQRVAKEVGKEVSQVLIRWSLQRGFVLFPKSSKIDRIISNADVFDFELSPKQMADIDALDEGASGAISWNPIHAD